MQNLKFNKILRVINWTSVRGIKQSSDKIRRQVNMTTYSS